VFDRESKVVNMREGTCGWKSPHIGVQGATGIVENPGALTSEIRAFFPPTYFRFHIH